MKQAANRSGSIRFIKMLIQRPEGTPQSNGRKRRKKPRWASPQLEMASKLSHFCDRGADAHQQNFVELVSHVFRAATILDPGKVVEQEPQPRRLLRSKRGGVHQAGSESGAS